MSTPTNSSRGPVPTPAAGGAANAIAGASAPPLDPALRRTLTAMMDLMIPASPDARLPAASTLDLYQDLSRLSPRERAVFDAGLADIDARARSAHGLAFAELPAASAMTLVEALRAEASAFLSLFTVQTTGRYLMHEAVMPLIGLEARPHWPKGHPVAQGDWSLIDVVRARPKLYREV